MYLQKVISFVDFWKVIDENSRIRIHSSEYGSADPDPYKNFLDPHHCFDVKNWNRTVPFAVRTVAFSQAGVGGLAGTQELILYTFISCAFPISFKGNG